MRYQEIAADLRRRILEGEYAAGMRLPGEQRLAEEYGVSRGALRNALAALKRRGLVESSPGSGWRVQAQLQTQEFMELRSFAQWATSRHLVPSGLVVHQEHSPANAVEARTLQVKLGEDLLRVMRLRSLDGAPVMVERSAYPPWVTADIEGLPADVPSVTQALLDAGVAMVYGTQRIDTTPASGEDAALLGVRPSTRLLRVRRVTYARDGRPIESSDDRYAPDTIAFELHSSSSTQLMGRARL